MTLFRPFCYHDKKGTAQRYTTQGLQALALHGVTRPVPFERYSAKGHNIIEYKKKVIKSESWGDVSEVNFPPPRALEISWDYTEGE